MNPCMRGGSGEVFIIAEAGVNHNGRLDIALELVEAALAAGADAVKFQTFVASRLAVQAAPMAGYQQRMLGPATSQIDMLRALELDAEAHRRLYDHCRQRGIAFLSTPFDLESIDLLTEGLGLEVLKIASGEVINGPLLFHAARKARRLILSTGMATAEEIQEALGVIACGFDPLGSVPYSAVARAAARERMMQTGELAHRLTLLHCTSDYPAAADQANLAAMNSLRDLFGLPVGLSDHTEGFMAAVIAAAHGACVLEKHLTLDRAMAGPDHRASLDPGGFAEMVRLVRQVPVLMGNPVKGPTAAEIANRPVIRRSLVAARPIAAGEPFSIANVTAKRPGTGLSPMHFWDLLGQPARRAYGQDEFIEP